MNSYVSITVRVNSRAALAEMAALKGETAAMTTGMTRAGTAGSAAFNSMLPRLSRFGNQLQWTGRMLQYNFTLPIAIAGIAATKFALDNEKAMTRVQKVYGDGSLSVKTMKDELDALGESFVQLSNKFGVAQSDVINIAADWAAAGASGIALAKSVDLTLQTMILGELDAAKATQQLIAVQAQYGMTVNELSKSIDVLNMVENQTGISMAGLLDVMSRASGVARNAGIPIRDLAAYAAALVPASGSASTAGNGLKTIITRLVAPTQTAADAMKALGINVNDAAWAHANGVERLQQYATASEAVSKAERNRAAAIVFGTYQVNRASILMREITSEHGYYQKALDSTADSAANFAQKQRELNQVLESNPQKLQQMWVILQNALADTIQPLLPTIVGLASEIAHLATWFANLSPEIQKVVGLALLFLALFGPFLRYLGATITLLRELSAGFVIVGKAIWAGLLKPLAVFVGTAVGAVMSGIGAVIGGVVRMAMSFWAAGVMIARAIDTMIIQAVLNGLGYMVLYLRSTVTAAAAGTAVVLQSTAVAVRGASIQLATYMLAVGGTARSALGALRAFFVGFAASVVISMRAAGLAVLNFIRVGVVAALSAVAAAIGPEVIAIAAAIGLVIALAYKFRDQVAAAFHWVIDQFTGANSVITGIINSIISAFYALPAGIQGAMQSIINIVSQTVMQVYEWLSYLNPFATHSPSLVSQVHDGLAIIKSEFGSLGSIGNDLRSVASDIKAFQAATRGLGTGEFSDARSAVSKVRPGAMPEFQNLIDDLRGLQSTARRLSGEMDHQTAVVARWQKALDGADKSLSNEQDKLDSLQSKLDKLTGAYDRHKEALQNYANAPIQGMQDMSDKIFKNEQAQKRLRLEILKWEQANGSIDDMKNNMALLAGDIEKLKGEAADLRSSGAGSDILGPINDQIAAMQDQYDQMTDTVNNAPIDQLSAQLEELQRKGEMLDLRNSLKFDDQLRQIDQLANGMKELPFNEIMDGIKHEQNAMDALQPHIDKVTKAIHDQERAVQVATAVRDQIQKRYDKEQNSLDRLTDRYNKVQDSIDKITSALNDMGSAAQSAIDKAKSAADKASGAGGAAAGAGGGGSPLGKPGTFPGVGGNAQVGRMGGPGSQADLIDQFTQGISDDVGDMFDSIDFLGPIKEKWDAAWNWVKTNIGPIFTQIGNALSDAWNSIFDALSGAGEPTALTNLFTTIRSTWDSISEMFSSFMTLIKPGLEDLWHSLVDFVKNIWKDLGPRFEAIIDLFVPLMEAVGHLIKFFSPVLKALFAVFAIAFSAIFNILASILGPVLHFITEFFGAIIQIFTSVMKVILSLINGDWSDAWHAFLDIFSGVWDAIFAVIRGAAGVVWGLFKGIWNSIVAIAKWLYNILVGHSIIPDLVKAIVNWFNWMIGPVKAAWNLLAAGIRFVWENILKPLFEGAKAVIEAFARVFQWIWDHIIKPAWDAIKAGIKAFWSGFLKPILQVIKEAVKGWAIIFKWIWQNIIKPAWDKIKDIISDFWKNFLKPIFDVIKTAVKGWAIIFREVWQNIIKPAWDAIKDGIKAVWQNVLKPLWDVIKAAFRDLGAIFRIVWNDVIKPAWDAIKQGISDAWDKIKGIWDAMKSAWHTVKGVFASVGSAIKGVFDSVWDKIQDVAGWVVEKIEWISEKLTDLKDKFSFLPGVAGGGLVVGGNAMGGLAGLAGGGKVLGPGSKTSDSVLARLSRGEFVVRAAAVDALGLPFMNWINSQGMASGGMAGSFGRADSAWGSSLTPTVVINNNTTLQFSGDLSFPNITDPDDADDFIENLKSLAG